MRDTIVAGALAALLAGCGAAAGRTTAPAAVPGSPAAEVARQLEAARLKERANDHFGASVYLDAALAAGGCEREILPRLIAAQIRAGRLRAARQSVARMRAIDADRRGIEELAILLERLAPGGRRDGAREPRR